MPSRASNSSTVINSSQPQDQRHQPLSRRRGAAIDAKRSAGRVIRAWAGEEGDGSSDLFGATQTRHRLGRELAGIEPLIFSEVIRPAMLLPQRQDPAFG